MYLFTALWLEPPLISPTSWDTLISSHFSSKEPLSCLFFNAGRLVHLHREQSRRTIPEAYLKKLQETLLRGFVEEKQWSDEIYNLNLIRIIQTLFCSSRLFVQYCIYLFDQNVICRFLIFLRILSLTFFIYGLCSALLSKLFPSSISMVSFCHRQGGEMPMTHPEIFLHSHFICFLHLALILNHLRSHGQSVTKFTDPVKGCHLPCLER